MTKQGFDLMLGVATLAIALLTASPAPATEEIGEREGIECQTCHVSPDQSPESLTDQGLYYQYLRTLAGYDRVLERFESCTYCHVERAGSAELTSQGHRFQWMMEDMVGLRVWLEQQHPSPAEAEEATAEGE